LGSRLVTALQQEGHTVVTVQAGTAFTRLGERVFSLNRYCSADYTSLLDQLRALGCPPQRIVHLWTVPPSGHQRSDQASFDEAQYDGFYSLLFLMQALETQPVTEKLEITVVSTEVYDVTGEEVFCPEKATVLALVNVIPQEYPYIRCRHLDLCPPM